MSGKSKHVYDYKVDLGGDTAPARVIGMVKPHSRVLEIGAGPGSITKHLVRTLNCEVVALEVEATAIRKLREFCPKVYELDLNDASWVSTLLSKEARFDYVIAADVLEHVVDPWKVLGGMKELLSPQGSVIVSLPHVSHAGLLGSLMDEDMTYRPWGLLDRTHIRFFGVKNVQSLFSSQGLAIEEAQFVVRTPEMTEFSHTWKNLPENVRSALQANRFSHVYQIVSRAVPIDRAHNRLDLLSIPVTPADPETTRQMTQLMASLPIDQSLDQRTTISSGGGGAQPDLDTLRQRASTVGKDVKLIAYYLPQFHPITENNQWWGKGFTEWTNVTKAVPRFPGHHQPHLPTDLGFYDLRVREVHHEQIALAKSYGIDGFCYHYYWFSGHRLLEKPLEAMLADPRAEMPYCLCWANENWTRRWDAGNNEILIAQKYQPEDDLEFIKSLDLHFRDPRYIRFNGAPLLIVYRPQHLPNARKSANIWRQHCRDVGIGEIHIASALTHGNWDHLKFGFDSGVEFPPHNFKAPNLSPEIAFTTPWRGKIPDYARIAEQYLQQQYGHARSVFRSVFPSWDNTARRGENGIVVLNGTPENYEHWLSEAIRRTREDFPGEERFVFINAWNEWAEGCHLEPDQRHGHEFLKATLRAKAGHGRTDWTHVGLNNNMRFPQGGTPVFEYGKNRKSALSRGFRAVRDTISGRGVKR